VEKAGKSQRRRSASGGKASPLASIPDGEADRLNSTIGEFDRVLGGGLVRGACVLVAGDPGIGKSTLLLQASSALEERGHTVLYVSGEESERQVKMRAGRLGVRGDTLYFLSETSVEAITGAMEKLDPNMVVVDSIQTLFTDTVQGVPGSVSQVRESSALLINYAKVNEIPLILVGHVTKEGAIAGPKLLEHMVDVVLYFEGEKGHQYRILRSVKNRFGSISEVGIFEMKEDGLKEVVDPSGVFSGRNHGEIPGMAVYPALHGSRTIMVEVQALVSRTYLPVPRRVVVGLDLSRSQILSTIVEKHCGVKLFNSDLYLNVTGGFKIVETGSDLAVVLAILSGALEFPVPQSMTAFGEVGLGGEVRGVRLPTQRISEAVRMGFRKILVPDSQYETADKSGEGVELVPIGDVRNLSRMFA
jgi:DNA repair protein RadA/Sms